MRIVGILLLSFTFTLAASGQQRSDLQSTDTASVRRIVIVDPGISLGRATLLLSPSFERDSLFIFPSFLHLKEDFPVGPPFVGGVFEERVDLLSPLRLQMGKESQLRSLQVVLGTVEIAGVAYLAYRHIKKYGFLR